MVTVPNFHFRKLNSVSDTDFYLFEMTGHQNSVSDTDFYLFIRCARAAK
jgi:hypothetical protein